MDYERLAKEACEAIALQLRIASQAAAALDRELYTLTWEGVQRDLATLAKFHAALLEG